MGFGREDNTEYLGLSRDVPSEDDPEYDVLSEDDQNTWDYPGMPQVRIMLSWDVPSEDDPETWNYPGMSLVRMAQKLGTILGCPW